MAGCADPPGLPPGNGLDDEGLAPTPEDPAALGEPERQKVCVRRRRTRREEETTGDEPPPQRPRASAGPAQQGGGAGVDDSSEPGEAANLRRPRSNGQVVGASRVAGQRADATATRAEADRLLAERTMQADRLLAARGDLAQALSRICLSITVRVKIVIFVKQNGCF